MRSYPIWGHDRGHRHSGVRDVSGQHYEYENAHSLAWNISTAAGMTSFEDAKLNPPLSMLYSRKDYDLSYPVKSAQTLNESTLSLAPLLRFTPTGMSPEDWWFNRILAWIPTELAKTPPTGIYGSGKYDLGSSTGYTEGNKTPGWRDKKRSRGQ
ncbi:hypothetical protein [Pantoea ananatis]|uniref:hypothetical protein n=1 Tax=Pantoea ananas TaxID=553 RepID=UPI00301996B4